MQYINLHYQTVCVIIQIKGLHARRFFLPDYKVMYFQLFNKVTAAMDILQKAQMEGEEEYIKNKDEPVLIMVKPSKDSEGKNQ